MGGGSKGLAMSTVGQSERNLDCPAKLGMVGGYPNSIHLILLNTPLVVLLMATAYIAELENNLSNQSTKVHLLGAICKCCEHKIIEFVVLGKPLVR